MKLAPLELQSAVWLKLQQHMEDRLGQLRQQNDGDLDPIATARVRGRSAMLKELLDLGRPDQEQES